MKEITLNIDGKEIKGRISEEEIEKLNMYLTKQEADLREADLRGANLSGADLRGADLDFSVWPLWCGSLGVKVDARIARQLAYHFCRLDCDDPEYRKVTRVVAEFANMFHRVEECGEIEEVQNGK